MGKDDDFSAFVTARWAGLVRAVVLLGATRPEAEDVVQSGLERCYRSWGSVSAASDPDAYAYRVVLNVLAKSRRRRWWGERPSAEVPEPMAGSGSASGWDGMDAVALSGTVRTALLRLSPEHREVLVLRFFADLSERQTAAALGIPPGTAKSRTSRALAQIADDASLTALFNHEES